jgi:hypothetical protein
MMYLDGIFYLGLAVASVHNLDIIIIHNDAHLLWIPTVAKDPSPMVSRIC